MKNLIIILMIFTTSCAVVNKGHQQNPGSEIPEYLSLEELEGDTVSYIIQSLYERKEYYIGKKVKVFLKDLELDIVDHIPGYDPRNMSIAPDISLYFIERGKLSTKATDDNKPLLINIYFEVPALLEPAKELQIKNNRKWTKEEYNYYKDLVIKDIGIPEFGIFRKYFEELE